MVLMRGEYPSLLAVVSTTDPTSVRPPGTADAVGEDLGFMPEVRHVPVPLDSRAR